MGEEGGFCCLYTASRCCSTVWISTAWKKLWVALFQEADLELVETWRKRPAQPGCRWCQAELKAGKGMGLALP